MTRDDMLAYLVKMNGGGVIFRPSAASIWLSCLGSRQLIARSPKSNRTSVYAQEGTAAHAVAQQALEGIREPEEWVNRKIHLDLEGKESWLVTAEMADFVRDYMYQINLRWRPGVERLIESRLTLTDADATDPLFAQCAGTADCVHVDVKEGKLTVIDLKYGKGVMVAGDSPQLKLYALMGLLKFRDRTRWVQVETVVVQPRAIQESERVKSVLFDPTDLLTDFLGYVAERMELALEPDPPLTTGSHCRWCDAKGTCPAVRADALAISQDPSADTRRGTSSMAPIPTSMLMGTIDDPRPAPRENTMVLPMATDLTPDEVSTILLKRKILDIWLEGVEHRAVQLLEGGVKVPFFALKRRTGNRAWKDEETAVAELRKAGAQTAAMYTDPKLKSPAQMEKSVGKRFAPLIESLVERPLGALTLVADAENKAASIPAPFGAIETST